MSRVSTIGEVPILGLLLSSSTEESIISSAVINSSIVDLREADLDRVTAGLSFAGVADRFELWPTAVRKVLTT
jgi:hypothetical protein